MPIILVAARTVRVGTLYMTTEEGNMNRHLMLGTILSLLAIPAVVHAASDSKTLTINAVVANRAKLTIAPLTINFPDADPDVVNPIPASENAVTVSSRVRTGSASVSTLTCLANGDLLDGASTIPISNVTWTSTGGGYVNGTMNNGVAQAAGSWTGSGLNAGTFSYFLANSWAYNIGNYTQTVLYTLTAP